MHPVYLAQHGAAGRHPWQVEFPLMHSHLPKENLLPLVPSGQSDAAASVRARHLAQQFYLD
jgi:hypothetical protein